MSYYVAIEGADGAGKTTLSNRLVERLLRAGRQTKLLREPCPDTQVGKYIRSRIQSKESLQNEGNREVEALLFTAARVEMFSSLKDSRELWVSDRSFLSTLAYQSKDMRSYYTLMQIFEIPRPDLVLWLSLSKEESARRAFERGDGISPGRLDLASERYVEAIQSLDTIEARIVQKRSQRYGETKIVKINTENTPIGQCEQIAFEAIEALYEKEGECF